MQKIIILTVLCLSAVCIYGQAKCELTLEQSPSLQNLKLGMSSEEAAKIVGIRIKSEPEGQSTFFKNYIKKKARRNLTGVRAIYLRFYDAKLYQIELFYEKEYLWQNLASFLDDYFDKSNFSKEFWQTEYGYSKATCNGFSLDADYILNPHIQLTNDRIAEIVEKERAAEAEKTTTKGF